MQDHQEVKKKEINIENVGLRVLSMRVRELVFVKRSTSYKEVADELINELIKEGKMSRESRSVIFPSLA